MRSLRGRIPAVNTTARLAILVPLPGAVTVVVRAVRAMRLNNIVHQLQRFDENRVVPPAYVISNAAAEHLAPRDGLKRPGGR